MDTQNKVSMENMTPEQSLETIWNLLNKAAGKGCFTIDESYVLKVLFNKVSENLKDTKENEATST
jgi:hypothetical protein